MTSTILETLRRKDFDSVSSDLQRSSELSIITRGRWSIVAHLLYKQVPARRQDALPRNGKASLGFDGSRQKAMSLLPSVHHCSFDQIPSKANPPNARGFKSISQVGSWVRRFWHPIQTKNYNKRTSTCRFHCWIYLRTRRISTEQKTAPNAYYTVDYVYRWLVDRL